MIWFYQRGSQAVRLETRYDKAAGEYTVKVTWSDNTTQEERYSSFAEYHARILVLERQLDAGEWTQTGPPAIIPGDWRPDNWES